MQSFHILSAMNIMFFFVFLHEIWKYYSSLHMHHHTHTLDQMYLSEFEHTPTKLMVLHSSAGFLQNLPKRRMASQGSVYDDMTGILSPV